MVIALIYLSLIMRLRFHCIPNREKFYLSYIILYKLNLIPLLKNTLTVPFWNLKFPISFLIFFPILQIVFLYLFVFSFFRFYTIFGLSSKRSDSIGVTFLTFDVVISTLVTVIVLIHKFFQKRILSVRFITHASQMMSAPNRSIIDDSIAF